MNRSRIPSFFLPLLLALGVISAILPGSGLAQEVAAEAALLSDRIAVGEIGTMIIRTINAPPEPMPARIEAGGLTIVKAHEEYSHRSDSRMGKVSQYLFYYQVTGQTEGKFTIPAQTLRVKNQTLTTKPLEITVFARKAGDEVLDAKRPHFAKLALSTREFYAGQLVPADLRIYVRGINAINDIGRMKLKHDQVVVKGFTQGETDAVQLDGIQFTTATLSGSMFVLTPGEYAIGPAEIEVRMIESSRFGPVGFFQSTTVRALQSDAIPVVVRPLPEAGKPDTFRGAVGNFQMTVSAKPKDLKVGDPISLEFEITGVGNLKSVEAPVLIAADPDAWRTYEARKIIDPTEDSDGQKSGRATFSQIVMPRAQVSELPPFELAWFNPVTGAYNTQRTDPIPITVAADERTGGLEMAATTVAAPGGTFAQPAAASPEAGFDDILFISMATPEWRPAAVPAPIQSRPGFWIAQAILSLALFIMLGVGLTRFARKRAAERRQEASQISFERAVAEIGHTVDRGGHYHSIQNALDAWRNESRTPAEKLPEAARSGYQALQSRCQWILYGAPDSERERPLSNHEAGENGQIIHALSGFLG